MCSQSEKAVKEKEQQLRDQEDRLQGLQQHLDKYAQMSAMIHNLTSGTVSMARNDEKPGPVKNKKK